jgi:hypothetical protein
MTIDDVMFAGAAAMEQMVADHIALSRAHRNGTLSEALAKIRERALNADRDDSGTPDATRNDAGPV